MTEAVNADVGPLVRMFEESEQSTREARIKAERDRDYYDGKQWTPDEVQALERRKQPVVTYNRIQRKIDFLSGLERQQRKDPKAFPRTPKDEDAADAATDAIRFVCDDAEWDDIRSAAWDNLLIEGTGIVFVGVQQGREGYDPMLAHIPWDRFFHDPASSRTDFDDARYMGIVTWYDADVAEEKGWPKEVVESTIAQAKDFETYDDKPKDNLWADYSRKRFRAIELYHKERGQWMRCVFTYGGYLEPKAPSPFVDEDGKPENPLKARSLYIDRDNNRYGAVRVLISPQDEVNKRRSKGLHLITMRQVRASRTVAEDPEEIRREMAKPDGIVLAEDGEFEILPTNDMAAANLQLLQEAKNEIDLLGANAALAGKNENDMSGRAILAQQQGGMVEVARMFDRLRSLSIDVYRGVWNRIRQVWPEERWIRVTDDERNMRFVGLNQKITVRMLAEEVGQGDPQAMQKAAKLVGPNVLQAYMQGDPQAQMALGLFVQQNGDQVVEVRNAVNELDVDIVIDEGMDTPTVQAEQFDAIVKMLPALGPMAQSPQMIATVIEASQLRNKDKLIQMIEEMQAAPPPDPRGEQMADLQLAGAQAQVENTQADTVKKLSDAQRQPTQADPMEAQFRAAEIETDRFAAVTDRIQAMQPEAPREAA
ncbi:portal protein [Tsuneonella sp. HG222]